MQRKPDPKWGRVWRYAGRRGVVWRIRYRDASGRRILETLGKEPAWDRDRDRAQKELRRRLVDVERDGYRKPQPLTLAAFAERWQTEHLPGRGLKQKPSTATGKPSTATSSPRSASTPSPSSSSSPN